MKRKPQEILPDFNKDVYRDEWQWQEGDLTVTRTAQYTAPGCHNSCSVLFYTDAEGKLVDIEGDPRSQYNNGRLCMRCLNMVETVNHPDRLKYPMKRDRADRGKDTWERISWDEAFDIIEAKVRQIWEESGPEAIVGLQGTGRNVIWQNPLLTFAGFGSPNVSMAFLSGDACYLPRLCCSVLCMGELFVSDASQFNEQRYSDEKWECPECMLIWGNNIVVTNGDGFFGHWTVDMMRMGMKTIVVDPRLTWLAAHADCWLPIRPGTDGALALAMSNVIIEEDLYDHDFVENWSYGFEDYAKRAEEYPPDEVEKICWVPAEGIRAAARMFANAKPGCIQWGLAVDQQKYGTEAARAICNITAMCGNIDAPGGNALSRTIYNIYGNYGCGIWTVPEDVVKKNLGQDASPLFAAGFGSESQGDSVLRAIEHGDPYQIRMTFMQGTNPIANMAADAPRVYRALRDKVEFNVICDVFMTPTMMAVADISLPAAMSCERNSARAWPWPLRSIVKVSQYYEAKSDEQIILELGRRLKPENWPFEKDTDLMTWWINSGDLKRKVSKKSTDTDEIEVNSNNSAWPPSAGFDWFELRDEVVKWEDYVYYKYRKGMLRPGNEPGFNTPTGLYEFKSTLLDMWGLDPLPFFAEPPESPYSTPELMDEYPLILTTGQRSYEFFHSEHRQLPTMREFHPYPITELHPETAEKYGIREGEWIWIENMRGRCRQIAHLNPSHPKWLVSSEHGWWYPEKEGAEPSLFGNFDSNINNLTQMDEFGPTGYGAPYKCQICKVYPDDGSSEKTVTESIINREGVANVC